MPEPSLLQRLKERKLIQWALAYLAGAWVLVQLLDAVKDPLGLSPAVHQGFLALLAVGFFLALVLAWYHGEKGRQRVSGPELLMVAALLVVAGVALGSLGSDRDNRGGVELERMDPSNPKEVRPTIAVLPFEDSRPNPEDSHFSDGLQMEIISALSKISGLRVISRSSVMQEGDESRAHGLLEEARLWLAEADAPGSPEPDLFIELAAAYALSGESNQALEALDDALSAGGTSEPWMLPLDPRFDSIRPRPRFQAFLERLQAKVDAMRRRVERGEVDLGIGD